MKKGLYIVATPIGNLGDISERAIETLQAADIIACEDTRVSKKLFNLLGIATNKPFIPLHDHNEEQKTQDLINLLQEGKSIALISDAGSPLISDPGYKFVRKCREQGVYTCVIPGCCAIISALQLCGLPTNRFMFAGFIPNKEKAREDLFSELKPINSTLVFYETAPRLLKTLQTAQTVFGQREFAVVREITKLFEEGLTDYPQNLIDYFTKNPPRGEIVFIVSPPNKDTQDSVDICAELKRIMGNMPLKAAVAEVVKNTKANKNEVYKTALEIKNEQR